ncbi:NAD(P)/FAD-dependent oxidoreductase [Myxosarcina sp. GI1]|uniref:NAD(P)/FAD-dependent oxidoreductase n=1 Tax=Myxosarcina sp. GI1 TaxID=1541065 RepID=UPI00056789DC|nr:NAD(P)/FAD-dependent oxidoreductase [Myxosarcina sp. GI1]
MLSKKPKIVVIGAGFAGLRAVQKLARSNADILLIDRHNYHTFVPLLYQVATGFISPEIIAYPLRRALHHISNARFLLAEVENIDFENKVIHTDRLDVTYDYLVLATGSQTKYLGVEGAPQYSLPLRTLEDAVRLRDRLLRNIERAAYESDLDRKQQLLTIVIVGGGPTGVELAGASIELITETLAKDYPKLDLSQLRLFLIHSGDRLLAGYPKALGNYTCRQLRRRGVKVHLNSRVSSVLPGAVELNDGITIETAAVVWTAGVEANLPNDESQLATAKKAKICVRSTLQLLEYPEVYAVGDVAFVKQDNKPLVGVAPEALQQGTAIARNLKRQLRGLAPQPFDYFNKGTAAIIARNAGVAYLFGKIPVKGFMGWLLWLVIHLYYLPGASNRLTLLISWIRDYLVRERRVRQIFAYQNSYAKDFLDSRQFQSRL